MLCYVLRIHIKQSRTEFGDLQRIRRRLPMLQPKFGQPRLPIEFKSLTVKIQPSAGPRIFLFRKPLLERELSLAGRRLLFAALAFAPSGDERLSDVSESLDDAARDD